jgi:Zn-dependent peptidase ImmA (M78 family)
MKGKMDLNYDALSLRKLLGADGYSPIDILSMAATNSELSLVFYPFSENVSGICIKNNDVKLIAINSKMSDGRQRFTIAHELYHLYFHRDIERFFCNMDMNFSKDPIEREADQFASYFIAPYEALRDFITLKLGKKKGEIQIEDVVYIEQTFKLSRQATLCRLLDEGFINQEKADLMKTGVMSSASQLGYDSTLYEHSKENRMRYTLGRYVSLAQKLHKNDVISEGKLNELLLSAFRSDLVFGDESQEEFIYD